MFHGIHKSKELCFSSEQLLLLHGKNEMHSNNGVVLLIKLLIELLIKEQLSIVFRECVSILK